MKISFIQFMCVLLLATASTAASAESDDDFPSVSFRGLLDARLVQVDAESTWLDGDLGKTRYGQGHASTQVKLAEAALIMLPRFNWSTSGYVHLKADAEQEHAIDLVEGYLAYQPVSTQDYHVRARVGVYYPPISLENSGLGWTSPYSLSYSAINTWVGEELRVLGAEASVIHEGELHDVSVVAALTAANDNAGTLLYRRGWAIHDFKPGINDSVPLPPRPYALTAPRDVDIPYLEIDERPGYYAGVNWHYDDRYSAHLLYYDNRADPAGRERGQSAWLTQFTSLGTELKLDHGVTLLAQYMIGDTLIDIGTRDIKIDYQAAYLLASRLMGKHRITLRGDWFETTNPGPVTSDQSERGWAAMAAYSYAVRPQQRMFLELLDIYSYRHMREDLGLREDATDLQLQVGYRFFF